MQATPDIPRLLRLVKVTLALNVGLVLVNAGMLYALLVFVVAEPAEVDGIDPFAAADEAEARADREKGDPREEMRDFFERTTDLLDRAARRHGTNPADVLPSRTELEEAIETRTIHSDKSEAVMQKLREGFDYYDLEWPTVVPER